MSADFNFDEVLSINSITLDIIKCKNIPDNEPFHLSFYRSKHGIWTITVHSHHCYTDAGKVRDYLKEKGFGLVVIEDDRVMCFDNDMQSLITLLKMKEGK